MANGETTQFPDFSKLEKVQELLDNNRVILSQIKENHESQRPDDLAKNFSLIQDVNNNIDKVLHMYRQISDDYGTFMKKGHGDTGTGGGSEHADQST